MFCVLPATFKPVAGCEKLLQKVGTGSTQHRFSTRSGAILPKKVPRFCCPFYRSFKGLFEVSMPNDRNARVHESRDGQTLVSGVYVPDTALA